MLLDTFDREHRIVFLPKRNSWSRDLCAKSSWRSNGRDCRVAVDRIEMRSRDAELMAHFPLVGHLIRLDVNRGESAFVAR